jgi:regulatory protein
VEKLRSLNYLNDETFARNWARSRAQSRGYGPNRIEQELRAKGIAPTLLHKVVRELFTDMDEAENAQRVLAKKFKGQDLSEPKARTRAAVFLQRQGYSSKVVFDLLRYSIEED